MASPRQALGLVAGAVMALGLLPATAHAGELPTVTAQATDGEASERNTQDVGAIEITRTGDTAEALDVNYVLRYGTAGAFSDYEHPGEDTENGGLAFTATATIPAGASSVELPIVSRQDRMPEAPERVVLTISHKEQSYAIGDPGDATVTIVDDEEPRAPAQPDDLVATRVGRRRVSLTWAPSSTNEQGIRVEHRPEGASGFQELETLPARSTNYLVKSVPAGKPAAYRVVAVNDTGESEPSSEAEAAAAPPKRHTWLRNVTVAREKGRFKAWPVNGGIWSWGDEIVVMYEDGELRRATGVQHSFAFERPLPIEQARSTDGGRTWTVEKDPIVKPGAPGFPADGQYGPELRELDEPIDFEDPNLALHVRMSNKDYGRSYWYYSYDRAKTWNGPFLLPDFGLATVNARTDYVVEGNRQILLLLSGTRNENTDADTYPFAARSADGGRTWNTLTRIADGGIQPSTVKLPSGALITTNRADGVDIYRSTDDAESWERIANVSVDGTDEGGSSPGSLTRLPDGRLLLTYGYRAPPFGIRARVSDDDGASWSDEVVLRADGGSFDLGYTRDALRPDGKIVTVYYFTTDPLAERTIEATIWDPIAAFGEAEKG